MMLADQKYIDEHRKRAKVRFKAIGIGLLFMAGWAFIHTAIFTRDGLFENQQLIVIGSTVIGICLTGYVTAYFAPRLELHNAGIVMFVMVFCTSRIDGTVAQDWQYIVLSEIGKLVWVMTFFGIGMMGAYVRKWQFDHSEVL